MTSKLIDAAIEESQTLIHDLEKQLAQQKQVLKSLLKARAQAMGKASKAMALTPDKVLPDMVEDLLRERGDMHVSEIVAALAEQAVSTNKQTLSSMFVRYVPPKGNRFRRTGPNRFGLMTAQ